MTLALFECPACQEAYVDELPQFGRYEAWPVHRLGGCGVDGLLLIQDLTRRGTRRIPRPGRFLTHS